MEKIQLIKSLDSIRKRIIEFQNESLLILGTLDFIECELNARVRNEDGESAFPLEFPKTCTPIIHESKNSKGEIQIAELEYCPTLGFENLKSFHLSEINDTPIEHIYTNSIGEKTLETWLNGKLVSTKQLK